jgi:hypothetical protein
MTPNTNPFATKREGPDTNGCYSSLDEDSEPGMANTKANDRVREYYRTQEEHDSAREEWKRVNDKNMKEEDEKIAAELSGKCPDISNTAMNLAQDDSDLEGEELPRPQCQIGDEPCDSCS